MKTNYYLNSLPTIADQNDKKVAAIVTNSDPFTMGQRKLFTMAASENDLVYCFVTKNDDAMFDQQTRVKFAEESLAQFSNGKVVSGDDFVPDLTQSTEFFKEQLVPKLNISRVYVGKKFLSMKTHFDNVTLAHELGPDMEVITIPDLELNGEAVSASRVRKAIKFGNFDEVEQMVAKPVYEYIKDSSKKQRYEKDAQC